MMNDSANSDYVAISVIVPVYNAEKFLSRCLNSLIKQTIKNIEIICVNDGSSDGSGQILDKFATEDKRIIVIHKKNEGAAIARNCAINVARGKYLAFCDADDWVDENFYERLYQNSNNGEIDIIKGNTAYESGKKTDKNGILNNIIKKHKGNIVAVFTYEWWSALYKKEIVEKNKIGFKKSLLGEDLYFIAHFLCHIKSYKIIDDVYYHYFNNDDSLTHKITPAHIVDVCSIFDDLILYILSQKIDNEDKALFIYDRIRFLIEFIGKAKENDKYELIKQYILKFIIVLNSLNSSYKEYAEIKNEESLNSYLDKPLICIEKKKYNLFGFIPIFCSEYKFPAPNAKIIKNDKFYDFLCHDIRENSVLMVEFNYFHGECLPGMAKYFLDLGYNVDVCLTEEESNLEPFAGIKDEKFHIFAMSRNDILKIVTHNIVERYMHLYINSDRVYINDEGFVPVLKYIGENIQLPKGKVLTLCHHADQYADIKPQSDKFKVVSLNKLPIFQSENVSMVNAHFFETFNRLKKHNLTTFVCVGQIESERKNHSVLIDAIDNILKSGIKNFKVTVIARAGNLNVPEHIKPYIDFMGRLSYKDMYNEMKKADFYLPLFDPENKQHERYISCGSSGSYQLIYGFSIPCIIAEKFQTSVNLFDNSNSISYKTNNDLSDAMKNAIEMSNEHYMSIVKNLQKLQRSIYQESLANLKRILKISEAVFPNNYFISLGECCFTRTVLTRYGMKAHKEQGELSCPFDLCICGFNSTVRVVKSKFSDYFNNLEWNQTNKLWINSKYGIYYNHDQDCSQYDKDKFIDRYKKRIENFEVMLSSGKRLFILSSVDEKISTNDVLDFGKYLNQKNKNNILLFVNISKNEQASILDFKQKMQAYGKQGINIFYAHIPQPYEDFYEQWYKYEYFNSDKGKAFEQKFIEKVKEVAEDHLGDTYETSEK